MLRARLLLLFLACGLVPADAPAAGAGDEYATTIFEVPLPGGLPAALALMQDRVAPDRSQFLLEVIRRVHHAAPGAFKTEPDRVREGLIAHLDAAILAQRTGNPDTLPLPLPQAVWTHGVFDGRLTTTSALPAEILRSRGPALLYSGLFSLDDETRVWLAARPALVRDIAWTFAARFLIAAPALRVSRGKVHVPGGERAEPVWQSLVGQPVGTPEAFVRALLADPTGRLPYFFGAMGGLTTSQVSLGLSLQDPDAGARIAAGRRLLRVFERIAPGWTVDARAFWRPARDPALLLADLQVSDDGSPVLRGGQDFWTAVLAPVKRDRGRLAPLPAVSLTSGAPLEFAWLAERLFSGDPGEEEARYLLVLFGSRMMAARPDETAGDLLEALTAAARFPALALGLERAGILDPAVHSLASRRAAALSAIGDRARAERALAQFQGTLALVLRAASRGSLPHTSLPGFISSLAAADVNERGDYEGRLVRWLAENLASANGDSMTLDARLLRAVAGSPAAVRYVEWEGTRYRLDFPAAESLRMSRRLGKDRRPFLEGAFTLVAVAEDISSTGARNLVAVVESLQTLARELGWDTSPPAAYGQTITLLRQIRDGGDRRIQTRILPALLTMADDLLARSLKEVAYAAALGHAERTSASAWEAAARHDFGLAAQRDSGMAWSLPVQQSDSPGWRVQGALLGLDVTLAEFWLVRLSQKPPARPPTLYHLERRAMIEAVALVEPAALNDTDRDIIASAIRRGRDRLLRAGTAAEATALAAGIGLSSVRRSLLQWIAAHDHPRLQAFLSPTELLRLGLEGRSISPALHAWGAPARSRLGCLCLRLPEGRTSETLTGRWHAGIFATGFPDLNLRLTELLADLGMPAGLLQPVLSSATLEFVDTAVARDEDDRRGLLEFVQALELEDLEQYLALLTTDGPLVPSDDPVADSEETGTGELSRRTDPEVPQ